MSNSVDALQELTPADVTTADALTLGDTEFPPPPPRTSVTTGAKRKRVVLSIHDKQQVLQRLESGEQPIAIARAFDISRQQVSDIKKNKDRIVAFCIDAKHMSTLKRKTLKATSEYHPGVEQELYRWLIRQRKLGRVVSAESLVTKTTDLFMQYSPDDSHISLKATTNWLRHFKKAHGIKALTEEELQQLPEQFVPAMDMTRPGMWSQHIPKRKPLSRRALEAWGHYPDITSPRSLQTIIQG
ncbi:Tc5 transposase DNA-binding domain [Phytophthora infestans]|uniref:Tc5 transposase DNA-binding domain n=1 Tax=Phytophthora infestans TaxID=4787 RepID=A0A833W677_PHYIN|nr:Tc5 transposase DNA-binding domain [Phytophthora infestans]